MISAEGAGVIATVIPIGLLIVGLEIQRVPGMLATGKAGSFLLWLFGALMITSLGSGFLAEVSLIVAVAAWEPLVGAHAVIVWTALALLGISAWILLLTSLADRLGLLEALGRRARERVNASPRRKSRQDEYIRTHHELG